MTLKVMHLANCSRLVELIAFGAMFFLVLSLTLDISENFVFLRDVPVLGSASSWNGMLNSLGLIMGLILLFTATLFALGETTLGHVAEERYRLLAENIHDIIWTMDLNGQMTYISPSVMEVRGFTQEEAMAGGMASSGPPENARIFAEALEEELALEETGAADPNRSRRVEIKLFHKDGSLVDAEIMMSFLRDPAGKPYGILGVTRDVTERMKAERDKKQLEEQLRQSQKMEAIGTLAGGIAHDFNNLLTGILGYSNLLKLESKPGDKVFEAADVIEKAADRASQLTKQLLGFARKGKNKNVQVDLPTIVQEVIALLSRTIDKNIVIVHKTFAPIRLSSWATPIDSNRLS